jgi:3-dehydroquinate synthase
VLAAVGLPTAYRGDAWADLREAMAVDKKSRGDRLRFVVLEDLARPVILDDPPEALLRDAYREVRAL